MSLNLVLNYETSALAAPQSFRDGMQAAANILDSLIQDNITVTIQVGYGDWYNNYDTGLTTGAEGGDLSGSYVSYGTLRAALATHTTSAIDLALINSLPVASSVNGVSSYWVSSAVEKALGLISPTANTLDGAVGIGTQISGSLLVGVALHELTHAMGRVPDNFSFDLVRYTSVGSQLFSTAATAPAAYFSVDGGYTKLADFGQTSDSSDFLNSGVQGTTDPFNEFYSWSTGQSLSIVDKQIMDAIGFNVIPPTPVQIEASGLTILDQVGLNYSLATGSAIVTLKYGGANVVVGEFGAWVPIGAEQVGSGYDVAWKDSILNRYTVWSTDSNGNYLASIVYPGSGTSTALESLETVFHQDLNGDGTIGVPTVVIHTNGPTSLTQVGENYYLYNAGVGPELKYGGAAVTIGEFAGGWAPIGAVQTASGYDVAWQVPGADRYTVWSTDSNGNYLASVVYPGSGSSFALESYETVFNQDLNGDGTIGVPVVVVHTNGSTSLTQVGENYYLYNAGVGPELKYGVAPVTVGEFAGGWTPIGAVQTASGYDVAWHVPGADRYTVWSTDSNGNYLASVVYPGSGSSFALESYETVFNQDLNGDGTIGVPTTVIHTNGPTSLTQVGENYYLYNAGVGPELKYGGAAVTIGEFAGGWAPIGAVQTASGYDVAWQVPGADRYTVWSTDSNGNYLASVVYPGSGSSFALESYETVFNQDLNGDGTIGVPVVVVHTNGSTSLTQVGENYYLYNAGVGPELKYGVAPVTVGEFAGGWTPIGAVQTASGYDVAWHVPGADRYTVWSTDSNGNYLESIVYPGSGSSTALESIETVFHQDLNGDGIIGIPPAASAFFASPSSTTSSFDGSTVSLTFGAASNIGATLVGFSGSNQIDLRGLSLAKLQSNFDASTGVLSVSDGSYTANLQFIGNYAQDSFKFADDGTGGTTIYVAPSPAGTSSASAVATATVAGEAFVFGPNFGQATLAHFDPSADSLQINHSVFADVNAFFAAAHDDGNGNVVVVDSLHDTLSIQHVTLAQLQSHQNDFHIV